MTDMMYDDRGAAEIEFREGTPTVIYGEMLFLRVCPACARFVKPNDTVFYSQDYGPKNESNAVCKNCGPVKMPFEGYYSPDEAD